MTSQLKTKEVTMHVCDGTTLSPFTAISKDINVKHIEHSLPHLCRYNGHTKKFYSVAQHAFICSVIAEEMDANEIYSDLAPDEHKAEMVEQWRIALHHDDAEAYVGDMIYPMKKDERFAAFNDESERLDKVIAIKRGLSELYNDHIGKIDRDMVYHEANSFGPIDLSEWQDPSNPQPEKLFRIRPLGPRLARLFYKARSEQLRIKHYKLMIKAVVEGESLSKAVSRTSPNGVFGHIKQGLRIFWLNTLVSVGKACMIMRK